MVVNTYCVFKYNSYKDIIIKNVDDQCFIRDIKHLNSLEESDFYYGHFGNSELKDGILGATGLINSSAVYAKINAELHEGDIVTVISYSTKQGCQLHVCDNRMWQASDFKTVWSTNCIVVSNFKATMDSTDCFYIGAFSLSTDYTPDISNVVVYVNKENVSLSQVGIQPLNFIPNNITPDSNIGKAKDKFLFSNDYFHDPYYTDGENIRNIETSLYSNVRTISKWNENMMHADNVIYKIVGNIDLDGGTKITPANCILDFSPGGTINNGTLHLSGAMLYPLGMNMKKYLKNVTVTGTYAEGQLIYDPDSKRMRYYNGTSWKFLTDSDS